MVAKLKAIKAELQRRMHDRMAEVGAWLRKVVLGYYQYHAVPGNTTQLRIFKLRVCRLWQSVLVRRSQRAQMRWERFTTTRHTRYWDKLKAPEKAGYISSQNRDVLFAALDMGSAAAHRGHAPTQSEVQSVMDIVENVFQAVYVFPQAGLTRVRPFSVPGAKHLIGGGSHTRPDCHTRV